MENDNATHTSPAQKRTEMVHGPADNKYKEGPVARAIEEQTAKLPSDWFLWAAIGSMGLSLGLLLARKKEESNFVGHWAPTLLVLGLYNKLVKLEGSDRSDAKSR